MKNLRIVIAFVLFAVSSTVHAQEATDYVGHQNEIAIRYLYANEIVSGNPDGTFRPDNFLVRAELMKILVLGAGFDPSAEDYKNCFPDVKEEWFARYVCFAKQKGWVEGYPDGSFKPDVNVNKVEAIKMLLEAFKVKLAGSNVNPYEDAPVTEWYGQYLSTAKEMNLLEDDGVNYYPGTAIKRGQVSENIYRLLMNEKSRFDISAEKTMCDYFYFADNDIFNTPLEAVNPLLIENLRNNDFVIDDDETFQAITTRNSYVGNNLFDNFAKVCEDQL